MGPIKLNFNFTEFSKNPRVINCGVFEQRVPDRLVLCTQSNLYRLQSAKTPVLRSLQLIKKTFSFYVILRYLKTGIVWNKQPITVLNT